MFTECQDSHCRSVAPMQDTPAVKMPYNATVRVKNVGYTVRMSANSTGTSLFGDWKIFNFQMDLPIPSYLIAFSVGNLQEVPIGPQGTRTTLITEPDNI